MGLRDLVVTVVLRIGTQAWVLLSAILTNLFPPFHHANVGIAPKQVLNITFPFLARWKGVYREMSSHRHVTGLDGRWLPGS